jgi:hypothetical protein
MAMTVLDVLEQPELIANAKRQFELDHPNGIEVL